MLHEWTHEEAARFAPEIYFLKQSFVPLFALSKTGFNRIPVASSE